MSMFASCQDATLVWLVFLPVLVVFLLLLRLPQSENSLFFGCNTRHTRSYPVYHSFQYPIFFVGVDPLNNCLKWPLSLRSSDYLRPGKEPLQEKMESVLRAHELDPSKISKTILLTTPRVFGYAFNPVSFWFMYSGDALWKVLLEVNNTFREKHAYLLDSKEGTFSKEFHVSPFNSRDGSYTCVCDDPLKRVDIRLVLSDKDGKKKLTATVAEQYRGSIPIYRLFVCFLTFPRIVWQAAQLYLRRRLRIHWLPNVLESKATMRGGSAGF